MSAIFNYNKWYALLHFEFYSVNFISLSFPPFHWCYQTAHRFQAILFGGRWRLSSFFFSDELHDFCWSEGCRTPTNGCWGGGGDPEACELLLLLIITDVTFTFFTSFSLKARLTDTCIVHNRYSRLACASI